MHQLVHLPIIEGHQALIQHPCQAGLFRPDGKAEAETLRQFRDGQLAQLVVSNGILELVQLRQHGLGIPMPHRRQSLQQVVGHLPLMLAEPGKQAGIIEHSRDHHLATHVREGDRPPLAATDQGIAAGRHHPGEVELLVQGGGLHQSDHHGGIATAQQCQRLLPAGSGHQLEAQSRLPTHFPQDIRTPANELSLLVDAAVWHETGIRHHLDGVGLADQPGLLLVGKMQGIHILLTLRQILAQIPVETARRQIADGRIHQLQQLGLVAHHQPVADDQIIAAKTAKAQPFIREFPHQVAELQIIAEIGAALASHQGTIPVLGIGQLLLG